MSTTAPLLDLRPDDLDIVCNVLRQHVPDREVLAFGSRATWTAKNYSDLDLAILGDEPLPLGVSSALAEAFSESYLPFKVDLVDWARIDKSFRKIILRDGLTVQIPPANSEAVDAVLRSSDSMDEWCEVKLGKLAKIKGGKRLPNGSGLVEYPTNYPYIRTRDIKGHKISVNDLLYVPESVFPSIKNYIVSKQDLIISIVGTIGLCAIVPDVLDKASLTENCAKLVNLDDEKIDRKFLYYFLVSPNGQDAIEQRIVGSTQPKLPLYNIKEIPLLVPPLSMQQSITAILSSLDDKIDLNRRTNETLEAMARAIFKDWFVDFGPTRAKAEGRAPYLAPELWDLFPDALDDEGKPVGWVTQPVNHLFEFNPRETLKMGTCAPYLDMAALPTSGLTPNLPRQRKFKSGSKYRDGDTLFARITPCLENGKTAFVFGLGDAVIGAGSTEFIVIRSKKPLPQAASYLLARDPEFRAHAKRSMTGTSGRQRANVAAAGNYEMTTPQAEGPWKALAALVEPLVDGVIANAQESRTLSETRDLLLPKLMSGEFRLGDAKKAIEAVA